MASGDFSIIPKSYTKTVGNTAATALYSISLQVPGFILSANKANTLSVMVGDSAVAVGEGFVLDAKQREIFLPFERDGTQKSTYDLNKWYVRATAASQVVTITILDRARDNG